MAPENSKYYEDVLAAVKLSASDSQVPPLLHSDPVEVGTFSPDGKFAVTGDKDGNVRIWSVRDGRLFQSLSASPGYYIRQVAFSPNGRTLLASGDDGAARIWSWPELRLIRTVRGTASVIYDASFSPDGASIATAEDDGKASIWSAIDGRLLFTLKGLHQDAVSSVTFSRDGKRIATIDRFGVGGHDVAGIWSATDGSLIASVHGGGALAFSPDGSMLVTASGNSAKVWESATGALTATLNGHTNQIVSVAFSHDGRRILTASWDGTARIWSPRGGNPAITLNAHSAISAANFSADDTRIVTAGWDGIGLVWSATDGSQIAALIGHSDRLNSLSLSPADNAILTVSDDNTARIWPAPKGGLIDISNCPDRSVPLSPTSQFCLEPGFDRWNGKSPARIYNRKGIVTTLQDSARTYEAAAISPDDRFFAQIDVLDEIGLWSVEDGRLIAKWKADTTGYNRPSLAFSPDGSNFATSSKDGTLRIWSSANGQLISTLRGGCDYSHAGGKRGLAFSPDSKSIAAACGDGRLFMWSAQNGQPLASIPINTSASYISFSADGKQMAAVNGDVVRIWSFTHSRIALTIDGASGAASFSPDGRRLVTLGGSTAMAVWSLTDGHLIGTMGDEGGSDTLYPDLVESATFTNGGNRLILSTGNSRVTIDAEAFTAPLSALERSVCRDVLGVTGRKFSSKDLESDILLLSEWGGANRDVCEGVPGVPSIAELRRRARLPEVAPKRH